MRRKVAYFVNEYPKVSHSFIRREILALEALGFEVLRVSLRGWDTPLVDPQDLLERDRTRYVLRGGIVALLVAFVSRALRSPFKTWRALALAVRMSRGAVRPLPYHLVCLAEACRALPWIRSFGASHLHAHFGTNSAEIAALIHALGGPPYSYTVHGQDELQYGGLDDKVRGAAFVAAISSHGRSLLYLKLPRSEWPKVKVIHCGVEPSFSAGAVEAFPTVRRVVCVARLCAEKGHVVLIEAVRELAERGLSFELVLAGDGEFRDELSELLTRYRLTDRVRITGWLTSEQVREEVLGAQVLVLPSFTEGLPVVIMEAMCLRRPVIATFVGGIPELVVPGEHGWLIPAGSVADLADAMAQALGASPAALAAMGENARRRVMLRHDVERSAAVLAELFDASAKSAG